MLGELGPVNYLVVLVWLVVRHLDVVLLREHLLSLPRSCVYLVGLLASQWFRPSVLLLRGGGHSSVGRSLQENCAIPMDKSVIISSGKSHTDGIPTKNVCRYHLVGILIFVGNSSVNTDEHISSENTDEHIPSVFF